MTDDENDDGARHPPATGIAALVLGVLTLVVAVAGGLWQSQSSGGIQWGRQIWVLTAFVILALSGASLGVASLLTSRARSYAVVGIILICLAGIAVSRLLF